MPRLDLAQLGDVKVARTIDERFVGVIMKALSIPVILVAVTSVSCETPRPDSNKPARKPQSYVDAKQMCKEPGIKRSYENVADCDKRLMK